MSETRTALGAIAAGHPLTVEAAEEMLRDGGNAFDAIVAAHFMACVAEPVLASLGGGGYMIAQRADAEPVVYDFFCQTPRRRTRSGALDFHPITADFGTVTQEFHIGLGSVAVPGTVRGMFEIHRDLCRLPMSRLVEPAVRAAREGVVFNALQAHIFQIVEAIYRATPAAEQAYRCAPAPGPLVREGDRLHQQELAATLVALASEGDTLFYRGELARRLHETCRAGGGLLGLDDLANYSVVRRRPLSVHYRDAVYHTNPPPASGGILVGFALKLLEHTEVGRLGFGTRAHLQLLATVMEQTNHARMDYLAAQERGEEDHLLEGAYLRRYRREVANRARCLRGTTHISVLDDAGNAAAMTVSNGEGCGHLLPGTGIMLNNILGEEDLNPGGFHLWAPDQRMTSMMSPGVLRLGNGSLIGLGSGGSNRIRTALLQVVCNLVDFRMSPEQAVERPRIHFENGHLNLEPGFAPDAVDAMCRDFPDHEVWSRQSLFFGGVHTVEQEASYRFHAVGDPRRGGVGRVVLS